MGTSINGDRTRVRIPLSFMQNAKVFQTEVAIIEQNARELLRKKTALPFLFLSQFIHEIQVAGNEEPQADIKNPILR